MHIAETMQNESVLTARQLEAIQSYLRVSLGDMTYREAAASATSKSVTVGSYFRTVQQARENIRKSIVTLLIGIWVGILKPEDLHKLLDVAKGELEGLSDEERSRYIEVLRVLLKKIVM